MLPKDANILLSIVNMKLRDSYSSLDRLCEDLEEDRAELEARLAAAGWHYSAETNSFIRG